MKIVEMEKKLRKVLEKLIIVSSMDGISFQKGGN
jgi:hypothetical protein